MVRLYSFLFTACVLCLCLCTPPASLVDALQLEVPYFGHKCISHEPQTHNSTIRVTFKASPSTYNHQPSPSPHGNRQQHHTDRQHRNHHHRHHHHHHHHEHQQHGQHQRKGLLERQDEVEDMSMPLDVYVIDSRYGVLLERKVLTDDMTLTLTGMSADSHLRFCLFHKAVNEHGVGARARRPQPIARRVSFELHETSRRDGDDVQAAAKHEHGMQLRERVVQLQEQVDELLVGLDAMHRRDIHVVQFHRNIDVNLMLNVLLTVAVVCLMAAVHASQLRALFGDFRTRASGASGVHLLSWVVTPGCLLVFLRRVIMASNCEKRKGR